MSDTKMDYQVDTTLGDMQPDQCPVLYALSIIGQKWKLPILWYLHEQETTRWGELRRRMPGITNMMLTKSLRELEEDGLVNRHQYDTVPPKVEYSLTQTGKDLLPTLNELYKWGEAQMKAK